MKNIYETESYIDVVTPKDISILVVEEFFSIVSFGRWFVEEFLEEDLQEATVAGAWQNLKISEEAVDICVVFESSNKKTAILLENKNAGNVFLSSKYFKVGQKGKELGFWEDFKIGIVAPEQIIEKAKKEEYISLYLSYEGLISWFGKHTNNRRALFKQKMLLQALPKEEDTFFTKEEEHIKEDISEPEEKILKKEDIKEGFKVLPAGAKNVPENYKLEQIKKASPFMNGYMLFCESDFADLTIRKHKVEQSNKDNWIYFRPEYFEKEANIIHKVKEGAVDLVIDGFTLSKMYETFEFLITSDMEIKQEQGVACVRIGVPPAKNVEDFAGVKDIIGFALVKARKLAAMYKKYIDKKKSTSSVSFGGGQGPLQNAIAKGSNQGGR